MGNLTLYLLVYHDKVNPAHWQLLLAEHGSESESETVAVRGTTIEVVSSYYGGFEHKISHDHDEVGSESLHSKIPLGLIDSSLISSTEIEECACGTDANGVDCNLRVGQVKWFLH